LVDVIADGPDVVPQVALGNYGDLVEVLPAGKVLSVLFEILSVLFLELVGDRLLVDERKDEFLVVSRVDGVSNNISAFEEVRFEVLQRDWHTNLVWGKCDMFCGKAFENIRPLRHTAGAFLL
jgi:hypothetical protein